MNRFPGVVSIVAGLCLAMAAQAGDGVAAGDCTEAQPVSPVLSEALAAIRAEQGRQIRQGASRSLAALRSETATALAAGAGAGGSTAVKAGP